MGCATEKNAQIIIINKTMSDKHSRYQAITELARMRKITPEEWVSMIDELDESIRLQVANIIWWDFFGTKTLRDTWHHLDHIIQKRVSVVADSQDLYTALLKCSYDPRIAATRLNLRSKGCKPRHAKKGELK